MSPVRFRAKVWAPMKGKGWTFAALPAKATKHLGVRGRVPVEGTINGFPFATSALPDGKGGHTIAVNAAMKRGANVAAGDSAAFELSKGTDVVRVWVPADLKKALAGNVTGKARWDSITPKARSEWVTWVTSAKQEATRERRVEQTVSRLLHGHKRPSDKS